MDLYSWYVKSNRKNKRKLKSNHLKSPVLTNNIENFTMWPTAKIKVNSDVKLPTLNKKEDHVFDNKNLILVSEK